MAEAQDAKVRSSRRAEAADVPLLELRDIHKSFGAVHALRGASLSLYRGQVTALVGENGAGKSTLVKTLAGLHQQDRGHVLLDGEEVSFRDPLHAREAGIAVIYQEPTMFPDLTVAENIFMGRQPLRSLRRIDRKAMRQQSLELFEQLGVKIDPDRAAQGLSIADQQVVEIAKAISLDARVLIMDEPTAALSGVEVDRLFAVTRTLQAQGAAVLFISHRFEEVFALADWITVMRDGAHVATAPASELTVDGVIRQMVGRDVASLFPKQETHDRAYRPRGEGTQPQGCLLGHFLHREGRRNRRPQRPCRRRDAPRWPGPSSASTNTTPAKYWSATSRSSPCPRGHRWPPGSRSCRKTGASRALSWS